MTTRHEMNCDSIPVLWRVHVDIEQKVYVDINMPMLIQTDG